MTLDIRKLSHCGLDGSLRVILIRNEVKKFLGGVMKKEYKVYYGDLHSHSIYSSDAVNTLEEIENRVLEIGNDFHAVTDHNSFEMNFQLKNKKSEIEFIYGVEMTNLFGHYNFLGREIPVEGFEVECEEKFIEKILLHKENGGYVTFNHPFSPKSCLCMLPITKEYCDFVEIWNGTWATHNKIALKWWHNQLLEDVYFPITGGSDTHDIKEKIKNYGNPTNCVIAPSKEQQVLLSQIKKGHSYILGAPRIIDIEFEDVIFGETIDLEGFKIKFSSEKDYNVHVITNLDKKVYSINDMPSEFEMKNYTFIRFEAYDDVNNCVLITNPIFSKGFGNRIKTQKVNFSDINRCLEEVDNKYLSVDGLNTRDIEIEMDMDLDKAYVLSFIIAGCISRDSKILELVNHENLSERNIANLKSLSEFLKKCDYGVMNIMSIRDELIQFEIVTPKLNYQVEVHLKIHHYCISEDFNPIAIDGIMIKTVK